MHDVCILLLLTVFHLYMNLVPSTYLVNKQNPWWEKKEIKRLSLLCFNTVFDLDGRKNKRLSWEEFKTIKKKKKQFSKK